ncbi:ATP-binding protein [Cryptosporangium sp. NPDC048952]|uniref:ATP-binding protein n=1 Tax=Cryptosporangium sp. NPDC048952 TaxID=3363961 RepID=UPI003714F4C1
MTGSGDQWEETFPPDPAVTPGIRRRIRGLLSEWKIADPAAEDTVLVVQELVANVIDHARTPFRVIVQMCGSVVKVCIRDYSATPINPRERDTGAFRGRGLQLVAGLSQQWGCEPEEPGKTVWAAIPV